MHPFVICAVSQVNYLFSAYAVSGGGLSCEVDDLVMYLIVTCDDNTSVRADQRMTYQKGLHATAAFLLQVKGVNTVSST